MTDQEYWDLNSPTLARHMPETDPIRIYERTRTFDQAVMFARWQTANSPKQYLVAIQQEVISEGPGFKISTEPAGSRSLIVPGLQHAYFHPAGYCTEQTAAHMVEAGQCFIEDDRETAELHRIWEA